MSRTEFFENSHFLTIFRNSAQSSCLNIEHGGLILALSNLFYMSFQRKNQRRNRFTPCDRLRPRSTRTTLISDSTHGGAFRSFCVGVGTFPMRGLGVRSGELGVSVLGGALRGFLDLGHVGMHSMRGIDVRGSR